MSSIEGYSDGGIPVDVLVSKAARRWLWAPALRLWVQHRDRADPHLCRQILCPRPANVRYFYFMFSHVTFRWQIQRNSILLKVSLVYAFPLSCVLKYLRHFAYCLGKQTNKQFCGFLHSLISCFFVTDCRGFFILYDYRYFPIFSIIYLYSCLHCYIIW